MALLTNQRMVWSGWSGGATFWAWMASIIVHLITLTAFGFVRFSQAEAGVKQNPVPTATISQIKKLVQAAPVIPKPKVKRPTKKKGITKDSDGLLAANQIFGTVKPVSKDWPNLVKPSVSMSEISLPSSADLREGIEFFGSFTDERKVCYVVDCSGSMQGVFGQVRKKLSESIGNLQPDQYFYIIFFGGDRLFEFGGKLLRATEEVKSAAYEFIDSVQPAGQTNALAAFERAVQIRDSIAQSSAVVYFLTDGFELTSEDERGFSRKVAKLLAKFAPRTRINTIGFWPQSDDCEMLRTIARQSGGDFVLVEDH